MARFTSSLDQVSIAAPCKADWEAMIGTDRVRFCCACNLNVYNLSSMTRQEAESFVARNEGRLCVRFYQRSDGSILTENCPVGLRAIRRRLANLARTAATFVVSFVAGLACVQPFQIQPEPTPLTGMIAINDTSMLPGHDFPPEIEPEKPIVSLGRPLLGRKKTRR